MTRLRIRRDAGEATRGTFLELSPGHWKKLDELSRQTGAAKWSIVEALLDGIPLDRVQLQSTDAVYNLPDSWAVPATQPELPIDTAA